MTLRTSAWALGLILLVAVPAWPQASPPAPPPSAPAPVQQPLAPSFEAVRRAWFVPETDARAFFAEFHPSLVEFALAAELRHETGRPLQELEAEERAAGGWPAFLRKVGGSLAALLFQGGARYGLQPLPAAADAVQAPAAEERLRLLAQVMTLERLTGDGPMAIRRELDSGSSFESLLQKNQPQTQESPRRPAPGRGEGRRRDGGQALLGGGAIGPKPGNSGFVETGGAPPPSASGTPPPR
ncbi:MAG: hypothetical protein ACP5VF_12380 [Acidobacteriota bacterium]